jgi:hypothetical protein
LDGSNEPTVVITNFLTLERVRLIGCVAAAILGIACNSENVLARKVSSECATDVRHDMFAGVLAGNDETGRAATATFSSLLC